MDGLRMALLRSLDDKSFLLNTPDKHQLNLSSVSKVSNLVKSSFGTLNMKLLSVAFAASILTIASAGPAAYGVCQAGCSGVVMACYGAAGFTWGATLGATAPASIIACNAAYGTCQAACAAVLLTPTP
jgi:hypothetical protein